MARRNAKADSAMRLLLDRQGKRMQALRDGERTVGTRLKALEKKSEQKSKTELIAFELGLEKHCLEMKKGANECHQQTNKLRNPLKKFVRSVQKLFPGITEDEDEDGDGPEQDPFPKFNGSDLIPSGIDDNLAAIQQAFAAVEEAFSPLLDGENSNNQVPN